MSLRYTRPGAKDGWVVVVRGMDGKVVCEESKATRNLAEEAAVRVMAKAAPDETMIVEIFPSHVMVKPTITIVSCGGRVVRLNGIEEDR
jgi:hypothetical protein